MSTTHNQGSTGAGTIHDKYVLSISYSVIWSPTVLQLEWSIWPMRSWTHLDSLTESNVTLSHPCQVFSFSHHYYLYAIICLLLILENCCPLVSGTFLVFVFWYVSSQITLSYISVALLCVTVQKDYFQFQNLKQETGLQILLIQSKSSE